ncbi:hypothetical protein LJC31_05040 [Synergistaceae bacterium OttesenSCG-928-I11]|nr:hypothetical protein [Synergistaceae bacterium OttesenSCG-928-I11]
MPQLSLYIDQETLTDIEREAKSRDMSISRFVADILRKNISPGWPDGYGALFGAIAEDASFAEPEELSFDDDVKRASL